MSECLGVICTILFVVSVWVFNLAVIHMLKMLEEELEYTNIKLNKLQENYWEHLYKHHDDE